MRTKVMLLVSIVLTLFFGCAKQSTNSYTDQLSIPAFGDDESGEIMCWNIENFPRTTKTDSMVAEIIKQLKVDFIAVEEIVDSAAFNHTVSLLGNYEGIITYYHDLDGYDYITQNVGFIYDTTVISVNSTELLFLNEYVFPRPPLKVNLTYRNGNKEIDFNVIVVHLKAMSDATSVSRRGASIDSLYNYLNRQKNANEPDFVVLGDWNSDYSQEDFLINTFVADSTYELLTYRFFENTLVYEHNASYPSYGSLIDHIVVNSSLESQMEILDVSTMRVDDYYVQYMDIISDHRPVAFKFFIK